MNYAVRNSTFPECRGKLEFAWGLQPRERSIMKCSAPLAMSSPPVAYTRKLSRASAPAARSCSATSASPWRTAPAQRGSATHSLKDLGTMDLDELQAQFDQLKEAAAPGTPGKGDKKAR